MTPESWIRLSDREQGRTAGRELFEGVPPHLDAPLRNWIYRSVQDGGGDWVALRLHLTPGSTGNSTAEVAKYLSTDPALNVLDVIDAILSAGGPMPRTRLDGPPEPGGALWMLERLDHLLREGSSAYRVNDDRNGLVRRVDTTATDAAHAAAEAAEADPKSGSAADQIRSAWNKLYDLHPDPPAAYRAAIQAAESAAHVVIEPNNAKATLGTMLGQLRNAPERYALAIPGPRGTGDVAPLIAMIDLLWSGQTSRHGGQDPTRPETFEEAQMAVHLAVTLVHWFTTGAATRR